MSTERVEMLLKARDGITPVLNRNKGNFKKWARALRTGLLAVTAAAGAALAALTKIAGQAAMFYDMADATGVNTDALQGLVYGIEQAGGSSRNLSMALRTQARFVGYLEQGLQTYTQYLDDLGLTYDDLRNKSPEDTFHMLSESLAGVQNEVRRTEIGMVMFGGRGMSAILAGLEQFDGSLRNAQEQFSALGAAMSEDQIAAGKEFMDFLTDIKKRLQALGAEGLMPLAPAFAELLDVLMDFAEKVMPSLIPLIESAVTTLGALVPIIGELAPAFELTAIVVGALATTLEAVTAALSNYESVQQDVIASASQMADQFADAVASGYMPMEQALDGLHNVADQTADTFGQLSDAHLEVLNAMKNLREEVATRLLANLTELHETLRQDVQNGLISASEAQDQYKESIADSLPLLQQYSDSMPILGGRLMELAELHVTLGDRMRGTWSKVTIFGMNLWSDFNTWMADELDDTGDDIVSSFDSTASEIQAIMEGLEGLGNIDLHNMQAFSDEIAEIHQQVLELNPEQLREYFGTMTAEMREQYAEYLDWLNEANEREMDAEDERRAQKNENSEKAMERIETEKQAAIAAIMEAESIRQAQIMQGAQLARDFGEGLFKAGLRGGEGMQAWHDKVEALIIDLVTSSFFKLFFDVISGGALGGLGSLFSGAGKVGGMAGGLKFSMGGDIPGGGHRRAAAGLTLPDYGPVGDKFLLWGSRGEKMLPREDNMRNRADSMRAALVAMGGGSARSTVNLISRNSLLTEGEMARVTTAVRGVG